MTAFVALLRAVNVGGTGKLPMRDMKEMCEALGFGGVRTYIASGNVVFTSRKSEAAVKAALEARLKAYAGKPVGVLVRSAAEMQAVLTDNPTWPCSPDEAQRNPGLQFTVDASRISLRSIRATIPCIWSRCGAGLQP